eukprot:gnl/TRDRNA2_/TRDRNA2_161197_c2_seq3.p1 gnl/TRDRNA2_/TRDRNA2_161197_c2~~gnl/TRDRNA2_/TRDRNA2_161197_c2_seq3.p1  ORF type:complete len:105 (-),score=5.77 gnl/TRDRNA2_/TRDRNA2_161197_c2_seq3:102-416(-)
MSSNGLKISQPMEAVVCLAARLIHSVKKKAYLLHAECAAGLCLAAVWKAFESSFITSHTGEKPVSLPKCLPGKWKATGHRVPRYTAEMSQACHSNWHETTPFVA